MRNRNNNTLSYTRRHLPHWIVADKTFFVTIRIAGSVLRSVIRTHKEERAKLHDTLPDEEALLALSRRQFLHIETILDSANDNHCWLTDPTIASQTIESLSWLENPSRG
jgi:hypothetical protein